MEKSNKETKKVVQKQLNENAGHIEKNNTKETKTENFSNKKNKIKRKRVEYKNNIIYMRAMSFVVMIIFLLGGSISRAEAISIKDNTISFNLNGINKEGTVPSENKYSDDSEDKKIITESDKDSSNNQKENNEKSKKEYKNTSEEGQKYIYDAVEVSKKLKNQDYSNNGKKIVFLTFDDGASNTVTPKILKILDDYNVKATFFIMGKVLEDGGENSKKLVKEEYNKGHAIGNHSYCHDYDILYPGRHLDLEAFENDYNKNDEELKSILGDEFSTRVIRCPGGYMSWKNMDKLDGYLEENNMVSIDWSALSGDAEGKKKDASQLLKYAVESSMNQEMVVLLMHDTYGKEETANSLPKIIEYFKGHGYEFRTLG